MVQTFGRTRTASPISKQIADLCGELESCLGNLSHWPDHALGLEGLRRFEELNVEEDVEEQTTCWILQDADEDDVNLAARASSAGDLHRQRPSSMPDLPNLMKSRPRVGLDKITKAGEGMDAAAPKGSDPAGEEVEDAQDSRNKCVAGFSADWKANNYLLDAGC
ncbi:unnamed protein product [Durusdinium trenchii]|uniref:Uncharacterized protein n=1 Tax=Durusdinium trenchii TaxID=1381693 RepID=A0ABP0T0K3_9DINO